MYVAPFSLSLSYTAQRKPRSSQATQDTLALHRLSKCVRVSLIPRLSGKRLEGGVNLQRDSRRHGAAPCL